jgi:hypothetical protein
MPLYLGEKAKKNYSIHSCFAVSIGITDTNNVITAPVCSRSHRSILDQVHHQMHSRGKVKRE